MENSQKVEFVEKIKLRTKGAAIQINFLTRKFEKNKELNVITYQIVKSATSVGANYRAASRAISDRALYSKMKIVEEEADETVFWLEILEEVSPNLSEEINSLKNEYEEFVKIFSKANFTLRQKLKK